MRSSSIVHDVHVFSLSTESARPHATRYKLTHTCAPFLTYPFSLLPGRRENTEARLSKNVYSPGEAVDCTVMIHQDQGPLDVRKIKAKLVQFVFAAKGRDILCMWRCEEPPPSR